jgi:hypothetical protein
MMIVTFLYFFSNKMFYNFSQLNLNIKNSLRGYYFESIKDNK